MITKNFNKIGFFCDTGILHGFCKEVDQHHKPCRNLLRNYPPEKYDYFTCSLVEKELKHQIKNIDKNLPGKKSSDDERLIARKFKRCIKKFLHKLKIFDAKNKEGLKELFKSLIVNLQEIMNYRSPNQRNDIEITTNAILWGYTYNCKFCCFITVDKIDIYDKRNKIYQIACHFLNSEEPPITIKYIGA